MTPERRKLIEGLFNSALGLETSRRAAFLRDACKGDISLQAEVAGLLSEDERGGICLEKVLLSPFPCPIEAPIFSNSELISQRYQIVRFLAKGGMGEVYEARDLEFNIPIALKTLLPDRNRSEEMIARFKREIQLARQVTHPNVCRVYDLGRCQHASQGDLPYLTMEFLEGETLARRIASAGRLSTEQALPIVRQMASALAAAHKLGIIHRDFKSSNVMLVPNENGPCVKVTDFGLARSISEELATELTISGQVMGTPPYMAPEQFRGQTSVASDIYAFGVVMYEMVTGTRPFKGGEAGNGRHAVAASELVRDLEPRWDAAIQKCLKLDPAQRFAKVEEVIAALEETPASDATTVTLRRQNAKRANRWVLPGSAMVILILAAFFLRGWIGGMLHPIPEQKHIAVLPFRNIGNDPNNEAFCEGLVETLTSKLSQLERYQKSFWVVPSTDSRSAKSLDEAYKNLNVTLVVTGSILRTANGVELIASLIDARSHKQLDSKRISTSLQELPSLPERAWERVADMIDLQVDPKIVRALAAGETKVPGAYDFYEQGLGYVKRYDLDQIDRAIELFQKALGKDPNYALAYAGLAEAYSKKYERTHDRQFIEQASWNGRRAIELDDTLALVHLALGQVYVRTGQLEAAIKEFHRVLEQDPSAVDAYYFLGEVYERQGKFDQAEDSFRTVVNRRSGYYLGHSGLGKCYYYRGRFRDAAEQFRTLIDLQPDNSLGYQNLGAALMAQCKYDEAIAFLKKGVELKPSAETWSNLGSAYLLQGSYSEAVPAMKKAVDLNPSNDVLWRNLADSYRKVSGGATNAVAAYRRALELAKAQFAIDPADGLTLSSIALYDAHLGESKAARESAARAQAMNPGDNEVLFTSALVYEIIGEPGKALDALDKAWRAGYSLCTIQREPELEPLRSDSRYKQWVARANGASIQE